MSRKQEIATSLNEVWVKLSTRWTGEDSNAFYQQYIAKMTEVVEDFGGSLHPTLVSEQPNSAKKLELIEYNITKRFGGNYEEATRITC